MTKTIKLVAFHGDPAIKAKYLARVEAHRVANEIVQEYGYWEDGKGCAVGCTLHGNQHKDYESELGIPEPIARLEDAIFENLPVELAKAWPSRFLSAIKPGADLSQVVDRFCFWLLTSPDMRLDELAEPDGKLAIARVVDLYRRRFDRDEPIATEWAAARAAASDAAGDVASNAAKAAALAAARVVAWTTTTSDASDAARSAAFAAAWATAWATVSDAARSAALAAGRAAAWVLMATGLEELLGSAPIATVDLADETVLKL